MTKKVGKTKRRVQSKIFNLIRYGIFTVVFTKFIY